MSDSVQPHGLQPTRLLRPWDSPGKNTGVGCHFLVQQSLLMFFRGYTKVKQYGKGMLKWMSYALVQLFLQAVFCHIYQTLKMIIPIGLVILI